MGKRKPRVLIIGIHHPGVVYGTDEDYPETGMAKSIIPGMNLIKPSDSLKRTISGVVGRLKKFGAQKIFLEIPKTENGARTCETFSKDHNADSFTAKLRVLTNEWFDEGEKELRKVCAGHGVVCSVLPYPFRKKVLQLIAILAFIVGDTPVYNVQFYDDKEILLKAYAMLGVGFNATEELKEARAEKRGHWESTNRRAMNEYNPNLFDEDYDREQKSGDEEIKKLEKLREDSRTIWWENSRKKRYGPMIENIKKAGLVDKSVIFCGADHAYYIAKGLGDSVVQQTLLFSWVFEHEPNISELLSGGSDVVDVGGSGREIVPRRREEG